MLIARDKANLKTAEYLQLHLLPLFALVINQAEQEDGYMTTVQSRYRYRLC